ncbi:hypothetical protein OSB04_009780 [Centaurea solstitialis]|uniref:Polygalacturonase n=1 Tax=Centaurea solstitialis TaxID=347529 RepID=A0AA38TJH1_9ASTR|nr:hypothetical protein OSB04_009780 [Centaurea solstitialis]
MLVFLSLFYISFGPKTANATIYDVTSYGAIGDGETDDSDLLGNITAPKTIEGWKGCDSSGQLILFESIQGLTINGPGQFDGQGSIWWPRGAHLTGPSCNCPSMLRFENCDGLQLSGTTHINSPKSHIHINGCQNVQVKNLHISAPEDSANTDGIDISQSSHVFIQHSTIQTGDDCVAVSTGTYDIHINGVSCGPGHGISIGSLGRDGSTAAVEQVHVKNCSIYGTQNGLRIKTSPFGQGYARGIVYEKIQLYNVGNPIIIDQHYCLDTENHYCPAPPTADAVQVSNVTYINVIGTSATKQAITFDCSEKFKCTEIYTNNVQITGEDVVAYCKNAQGNFISTSPDIACN